MNNKSSKLHFHFFLQDSSFCNLIQMIKKRTFKIEFSKDAPANSYQSSFLNVKLKKFLFHFLLQDCSICQIKRKQRGHWLFVFMPPQKRKKIVNSIWIHNPKQRRRATSVASVLLQPPVWPTVLRIWYVTGRCAYSSLEQEKKQEQSVKVVLVA